MSNRGISKEQQDRVFMDLGLVVAGVAPEGAVREQIAGFAIGLMAAGEIKDLAEEGLQIIQMVQQEELETLMDAISSAIELEPEKGEAFLAIAELITRIKSGDQNAFVGSSISICMNTNLFLMEAAPMETMGKE